MDNLQIQITAEHPDTLHRAVELVMTLLPTQAVTHYIRRPDNTIEFYAGTTMLCSGAIPFPCPLRTPEVQAIIQGLLATMEYPSEPDIDGTCKKGWTILYRQRIQDNPNTFSLIPTWALYHK